MSKYKTVDDFISDCKMGLDIEFSYAGIGYGILAWYEGGPMAYRKDEYGYFERQFTTADELLDSFMLGNVPLRKVITEVEKD